MTETLQSSIAPGWKTVATVVENNTRDLLAKPFRAVEAVMAWFEALAIFRETESERLIMADPTAEDLRWHKATLAALVADGERLLLELQAAGGLPENVKRIKYADLQAAVSHLYDGLVTWHDPMPKEQRDAILKTVFDVASPGT